MDDPSNTNITSIINAAAAAASKHNEDSVSKQPAFWILMFIIGIIVLAMLGAAGSERRYEREIKEAINRNQSEEVRAWLLREEIRIHEKEKCLFGETRGMYRLRELEEARAKGVKEGRAMEVEVARLRGVEEGRGRGEKMHGSEDGWTEEELF